MTETLLDIADLNVAFGKVAAVAGVSLTVASGEAVGIVGESGSGKSATVLAAMRLHPPQARVTAARLSLAGRDLRDLPEKAMGDVRGRLAAMIFQDPLTALNPLLPVGTQIAEVLTRHRGFSRAAARAEASARLDQVGIRDASRRARQYPHEFSGGMRQRVMIAAALAGDPALLIADEPTTALDVTVQADLVRLIAGLQQERRMGLVWVTHDLALMAGVVDRVVVMYAGRVMESAPVAELYRAPKHPYTAALLGSLPRLDSGRGRVLAGTPPDLSRPVSGCVFAPRCAARMARCDEAPPMFASGTSQVACWLADSS
jgi:oligopeptide/dipeptide ABC transporter ATP-binding protein